MERVVKKLLYVCEADSGGIMEYAIRQSEAIAREGVEVHFLCKSSFPVERLADGIKVWEFNKSRGLSDQRRGLAGKILRVLGMISDLRSEAKQVDQLAEELASSPKSELTTAATTEDLGRCEIAQSQIGPKGEGVGTTESKSTEEEKAATLKSEKLKHNFEPLISQIDTDYEADAGLRPGSQAGTEFSNTFTSELARDSENASITRSAIGPASESTTRAPLPVTRHNLGDAEVAVLFACYKEYFAPFWVGPLRRLARRGLMIGTIAHDPVRDFVVGPLRWHRWSVRLGYSFVRHVFVHDDTPVDFGGKRPDGIEVHEIPHGPYEVAEPKNGRLEMRRRLRFDGSADSGLLIAEGRVAPEDGRSQLGDREKEDDLTANHTNMREWGEAGLRLDKPSGAAFSNSSTSELEREPENTSLIRSASSPAFLPATSHSQLATPASPDVVFLAFGQIRDGKNLDLFLRAMTRLPENVKLLVAGKGDSGSSRPLEFYQKLAEELGVAERCRWDIRRIPEDEVGDIFAASDVVLVTYSAKFRSASGVLNAAVSARKPVLASSGPGPLKTVVEKYHLGVFVAPDNPGEILKGTQMILDSLLPCATRDQSLATSTLLKPVWDKYEKENSWEENARIVVEKMTPVEGNAEGKEISIDI